MAARRCVVCRCCENSDASLVADIDYHGLLMSATYRSSRVKYSDKVLIIKEILLRKEEGCQVLAYL